MARNRGGGSIVQLEKDRPRGKCRKWRLVLSLGRDPLTGRYPQKSRTYHGTYSGAKAALREFQDELDGGGAVRKSGVTLDEWGEEFCEAREASGGFAPQTVDADRSHFSQVSHLLGKTRVQDLTAEAIEAAYRELRAGNSKSGKGLSGTTLSKVHATLKMALDAAVARGLIAENPCAGVQAPRKDTRERRAMPEAALRNLVAALDPADGRQCAILLEITLGLRRGEACGLSWSDVDLGAGTVEVRHSLDVHGNLKGPKTESGVRVLPVPPAAEEALRRRRERLEADFGGAGADGRLGPDDAVCTGMLGERIPVTTLSHWWRRNREALGAGGWTMHELRHTFLSIAASRGVHPSVMQKLAGHKSPVVTLRIYTHVNMAEKRAAMEAMQGAFSA